jgi:hypothetical protein
MSRLKFKPQRPERNINTAFPFQVAFRVPASTAGVPSAEMNSYCATHLLPYRTRRDMRRHLRYCFSTSADADSFASVFGGERITVRNHN